MPTYQWVKPTAFNNPTGDWINPAMAEDDNLSTYAYTSKFSNPAFGVFDATPWLYLVLPYAMWIDKVQFLYDAPTTNNNLLYLYFYTNINARYFTNGLGIVIYLPEYVGYDLLSDVAGNQPNAQGVLTTWDIRTGNSLRTTTNPIPVYTDTLQIAIAQVASLAGERRIYDIAVEQVVPDKIIVEDELLNPDGTRVTTTRHLTSLSPVIFG